MPYTLNPLSLGTDSVTSGFRIRRTLATTQGQQSAADKTVAGVLAELDGILRKKIVPQGDKGVDLLKRVAGAKLSPRRADRDGDDAWPKGSVVALVRAEVAASTERTIAAAIAARADVADLRFALDTALGERWSLLDPSVRIVLGYTAIRDLLFARAVFVHGLRTSTSVLSYLLSDTGGVAAVVDYAVVSAARRLALDEAIAAPELTKDSGTIAAALSAADIPLTDGGFRPLALKIVRGELDSAKYDDIIAASGITAIPAYLKTRLVTLLSQSPVQPTTENAPFLVQLYLEKAAASSAAPESLTSLDPFAVEFYGDDASADAVNTAAVRCAAQLYYVMTLGDELGVFDAVRFFTDSYLFHDGLAITDPVLRKDLEDYVFSNRFPVVDPSTGLTDKVDVTREPMRRAYYRQVFNSGDAPTAGDAPVNEEFGRLWKILILESARYLERAQISPHPDSFVSRQNVMQAVEDLQYNLSTNCVGLATVMTPMMNAELDFVIKRLIGHPEIRQHVVPSGGSWLKVIDRLAAARGTRARTSVLNNKARLGYSLISSIAEYTPWTFEQDAAFSEFISTVDAFITTQSILQEDAHGDDGDDASRGGGSSGIPGLPSGLPGLPGGLPGMPSGLPGMGGMPGLNGNGSSGSPAAGSDDWDF